MFKWMGSGNSDLSSSQLLLIPGNTHIKVLYRANWLIPMIEEFLGSTT